MAKRKKVSKAAEGIKKNSRVTNLDEAKGIAQDLNESNDIKNVTTTKGNDELEKTNSKKRVKLTTMINPELRDELKLLSIKRRCNFSDVLEDAIKKYLE